MLITMPWSDCFVGSINLKRYVKVFEKVQIYIENTSL